MVVIRFADPKGIDFPYLLSMLHDSFMSRANTIVVPGGKMELAMQLIFTPFIWRMMERRQRALAALMDAAADRHRRGVRLANALRALAMRCGGAGAIRPPRHADGHGRDGGGAVDAVICATTPPTRSGPTATASCSPTATGRCCSTRCCT